MRAFLLHLLNVSLVLGLSPHFALAQGTKSDYERAESLPKLFSGKVYKTTLQANWFANGTKFWYRNDLANGAREFILVDAVAGKRTPAFDHAKVAAVLSKTSGKKVNSTYLPIERLEFSETEPTVLLRGAEKSWRLNLETYELVNGSGTVKTASSVPVLDAPRASQRTGEETSVTFMNRTESTVELFWIGEDGQRTHYASIRAGGQHEQHTFAGHVWLAADKAGKPVAVFEAADAAGTAIIDGTWKGRERTNPPAERRRRGQRNGSGGGGFESPDGKHVAFFKDHNLFIREPDSGEEYSLSTDGSADDEYSGRVWWSPDSKRVVALRTKAGDDRKVYYVESSPKDQLQPKLHSYDYLKPGDKIPLAKPQLFDPDKRKHIPVSDELFPNPWSITELRWEPDSSRFTFLYNQRGHQVMRVISVRGESGEISALVDEQCKTFFCYSSKQFLQHLPATKELIWMSERDGWNHLYLYDAATGKVKNQITRGDWGVRKVERVDEQNRQVWFTAGGIRAGQDPYFIHYCRVNFDGTGLTVLTEGDGTHAIEFSPDQRFFVDTFSRVDLPPVHELRRSEDGKLICELERADGSELLKTGWRAPERFVAKGRDGETDIYGIIVRPTNFDANKKYPVIEDIYAGPHDSFVPKSFQTYYKMQSMAELGFVVVKIDGMGTSNRSKKFHDVCFKNLKDAGFPDRIAWMKAAAAQHPEMDLSRVGVYGGSAGGQNSTGALLFHGDFYKVAVSDCGCHDNRMDKIWWNEQWMSWPVGPEYADNSNMTHARNLTGKLMLFVGEMDENVDPASTMQLANALIKADKDFDLVVIPGAGHGSAEGKYGTRRRADFFVRNLLGVEPRVH
ncbi:MAG: Prolyl tripeptidyl peptidase precursor [Verrucomicrobiota bacterium]|jgi:dipeptidyl aminopeptidase/acylaminoacyl peptidase